MDFQLSLKRIRLGNNNINNKPATITIQGLRIIDVTDKTDDIITKDIADLILDR